MRKHQVAMGAGPKPEFLPLTTKSMSGLLDLRFLNENRMMTTDVY